MIPWWPLFVVESVAVLAGSTFLGVIIYASMPGPRDLRDRYVRCGAFGGFMGGLAGLFLMLGIGDEIREFLGRENMGYFCIAFFAVCAVAGAVAVVDLKGLGRD